MSKRKVKRLVKNTTILVGGAAASCAAIVLTLKALMYTAIFVLGLIVAIMQGIPI